MVLKNNSLRQKMEKVAKRQQHFGIRKLTIGAASVLLGTTLWMGLGSENAHAAEVDNGNNNNGDASEATPHAATNQDGAKPSDADKAVVVTDQNLSQDKSVEGKLTAEDTNKTETNRKADSIVGKNTKSEVAHHDQTSAAKSNNAAVQKSNEQTAPTEDKTGSGVETKSAAQDQNKVTPSTQAGEEKAAGEAAKSISQNGGVQASHQTKGNKEEFDLGKSGLAGQTQSNDKLGEDTASQLLNIQGEKAYTSAIGNAVDSKAAIKAALFTSLYNNSANKGINLESENNQVITYTNSNEYPDTNGIVPSSQFISEQARFGTGRNAVIVTIATDNNVENAGRNIHYYITDTNFTRTYESGSLTGPKKTKVGPGIKYSIGLNPYFISSNGKVYSSINIKDTTNANDVYPIYRSGNRTVLNPTSTQTSSLPTKVPQTVKYIDVDTGEEIAPADTVEGISGKKYTVNTNKNIPGYSYVPYTSDLLSKYPNITKFEKELGVPTTGILNYKYNGCTYVRGMQNRSLDTIIFEHHIVNDRGDEDVYVYSSNPENPNRRLLGQARVPVNSTDANVAGYLITTVGFKPNNNIVLLYKKTATPQNAQITFVDDDNGGAEVPNIDAQSASGDSGTQIDFANADNTVNSIISNGKYIYNGTTGIGVVNGDSTGSFSNVSLPSYDKDDSTTQRFVVHFKHAINPELQTKTVNETVHYKYETGETASQDKTAQVTFTGTAYKDAVTGGYVKSESDHTPVSGNAIVSNWTVQNGLTDNGTFETVTSPEIPDHSISRIVDNRGTNNYNDGQGNVKSIPVNHSSNDIEATVYYKKNAAKLHAGIPEIKKVTRTINYYDKVTGQKIPSNLINTNPVVDTATFTRTPIYDENNHLLGYGTLKADGTGYTPEDWHTNYGETSTSFDARRSNDLSAYYYTTPEYDDGANASVVPANQNVTVDTSDQVINVYYGHQTQNVPENATVKRNFHYVFTDGTKPEDHINELKQIDSQTVTFNGNATKDLVTGTTTPIKWDKDTQTLSSVDPQPVTGYDITGNVNANPDGSVDAKDVTPTSSDIDVTIVYTPKKKTPATPQKATVEIIDKTDNKQLSSFPNDHGVTGEVISFDGEPQTLEAYLNLGYKLDSATDSDGKSIVSEDGKTITFPKFDNIDNNVQDFKIYLVHDTESTTETKNTTSTIHYQNTDRQPVAPDNVQSITWTRPVTKDKVTKETTPAGNWSTPGTFTDVTSPDISGYTPDKSHVQAEVPSEPKDIETTVTYTPETIKQAEKANLKIYDLNQKISDRNYQQIGDTFNASGDDNTQIIFTNAQTTIDSLIKAGYKVNSIYSDGNKLDTTDYGSASKDWTFDEKPGQDQSFVVYLEHDTEDINKNNNHGINLHHTLTETVHYMEDGTTNKVASDAHNSVDFDGKGTIDKVTGKLIEEEKHADGLYYPKKDAQGNWIEKDLKDTTSDDFIWSTSNPFKEINSPDIKGMHFTRMDPATAAAANGRDVKSYDVDHNTKDWEVTVYYAADPVYTHSAGLKIYTGTEGQAESEFTPNGSASINNAQPGSDIKFGYKGNLDKLIKAGYTVKDVKDVTDSKNPKTLTVSQNYDEIESQFGKISSENKNTDQEFAIYLTKPAPKSQQQAQLIINDVTPGQEQQLGSYAQPGLEGDAISFTEANTQLQKLLNNGYVWDSATYNNGSTDLSSSNYSSFDYGKFDNTDDSKGTSQKWVINLVHGYTPVDKDHPDDKDGYTKEYLDRKITRDVKYVDTKGQEMPDLSTEHQETEFTGSGYRDKVTGKWVTVANDKITGLADGLTWTPKEDQTFAKIDAKTAKDYHVISVSGSGVSGYTLGKDGAVGQQTVTKDTPSSSITVVYDKTPVQTNGSLTYIDDTTGKTLSTTTFGGEAGQPITYTTAKPIADYVSQGYKLEKTDFTDGKETFNSDPTKNVFEVHLVHATAPVDPNHTPTPGKEVPDDPDKHTYPNNTVPTDLTKDVTRTVSYQYEDGKQALPSVPQKVTFTGKGTIDLVTGNLVDPDNIKAQNGKITWTSTPTNAQYSEVPAIDTTKYSIIKVSENGTKANVDTTNGKVDSETVTPQNPDSTIVITLAKKQQQAALVFHDDTSNVDLTSSIPAQGTTDDAISFTNADKILAGYVDGENAKYKFVSTTEDGQTTPLTTDEANALTKFGNYDAKTKSFVIHLVHNVTKVDHNNPGRFDLEKKIIRDVKYQYENGDQAAEPVAQSTEFYGEGYIDNVTGQLVDYENGQIQKNADGSIKQGQIKWSVRGGTTDSDSFADIPAPTVPNASIVKIETKGNTDGYQVTDQGEVTEQQLTHNSADSHVVITYKKGETPKTDQTITVDYQDDTTGKIIPGHKWTFSTEAGQSLNGYSTDTDIQNIEKLGYKFVNDEFSDAKLNDTMPEKGGTYIVHFVHDYKPVNPGNPNKPNDPSNNYQGINLVHNVTRDIQYVISDGGATAPAEKKETKTFIANGYVDTVTGKLVQVKANDKSTNDDKGNIVGGDIVKDANGNIAQGSLTWTVKGGNKDSATFEEVDNEVVDGYKVTSITPSSDATDSDLKGVKSYDVNHSSADKTIVVVYTKNPTTPVAQQAEVIYQDVNDPAAPVTITTKAGLTGQSGDPINYKTADEISKLEKEGYVLVSNGFDPDGIAPVYDNASGTQTFYVKLKHAVIPVTPDKPGNGLDDKTLTKTVTETVHYIADGAQNVPGDKHAELKFNGTAYYDSVTKKWTDAQGKELSEADQKNPVRTWTPVTGTSFNTVVSPTIDGYHVVSVKDHNDSNKDYNDGQNNVKSVDGISETTPNFQVDVTYKPDTPEDQHLTVKYYDDTDPSTDLSNYNFDKSGAAGSDLNYTTHDSITELKNKGYKLVSDSYTAANLGDKMPAKGGNYEVHLVHQYVTVTPKDPGKPGEPVEPGKDPKYPNGTGIENLQKQGTMTVTYVIDGNDPNKPVAPEKQTREITFTKSITFDEVTGKITKDSGWNVDSQTYPIINSPTVEGYTPNKVAVGGETKNVNDSNLNVDYIVHYTKNNTPVDNTQKAKVVYQDINNPSNVITLSTDDSTTVTSLTGQPGSKINYSTSDKIKHYEDEGYVLVNDGFPKDAAFDNDNSTDQTFYVKLKHGTQPVNPENPGKPGDRINPKDPRPKDEQPKYPNGTDKLSITAGRTIHYIKEDNNGHRTEFMDPIDQTTTFTASGVLDKVTGKWVNPDGKDGLEWSGNGDLSGRKSPVIDGWHLVSISKDSKDQKNVDATTVNAQTGTYEVDVIYKPNGKVIPIDKTTGKQIPGTNTPTFPTDPTDPTKVDKTKIPGVPSGFTPENPTQIPGSNINPDPNNPGSDVKVPFVPAKPTVNDQTVQIKYVDDSTVGKQDLSGYDKSFSGKPGDSIGNVYTTKQSITDLENKGFKLVKDEFTNANLDNKIPEQGGTYIVHLVHETIPVTPDKPKDPTDPINDPKKDPDGPKYPSGLTKTDLNKTVTRTINYVDSDGKTVNGSPDGKSSYIQTAHFSRTAIVDRVTGDLLGYDTDNDGQVDVKNGDYAWKSTDNTFDEVVSKDPSAVGYDHVDIHKVGKQTVAHNSDDQTFTVIYSKNPKAPENQDASLTVIDETTNKQLAYYTNSGQPNTSINFGNASTNIQDLLNRGYVWDATKTTGNAKDYAGLGIDKFDNDSSKPQAWTVYLKHGIDHVTHDNPGHGYTAGELQRTVTTTVNYVTDDGKTTLTQPIMNKSTFTADAYFDKVTGGMVTVKDGNIAGPATKLTWTVDKNFDVIPTKSFKGYDYKSGYGSVDPDLKVNFKDGSVSAQTMTPTTADSNITFVYGKHVDAPVAAKGTLKYIDDTEKKEIGSANFSGQVGGDIEYDTTSTLNDLKDRGYKVISNNYDSTDKKFNSDPTKNNFEIHLVHSTKHVDHNTPGHGYKSTDLEKTVTTTVHYVDEAGHTLADDVTNSEKFEGTGDYDVVTGEWVTVDKDGNITGKSDGIKWNQDKKVKDAIDAKAIKGYDYISGHGTVDQNLKVDFKNGSVPAQTMMPTTANSDITFVYKKHVDAPVAASGSVTYVDDTENGATLEHAKFGGKVGDKIDYTTNDRISFWKSKGYDLVGTDPFKDGEQTYDKDVKNNTFVIHLVHTTTHIDKDHPGHGYSADDLQRTITTKVKYVDEHGTQLAKPVNESVTFTASGDIDNVTGHWVTVKDGKITGQASGLTWNKTEEIWNAIPAQTIKGYDLHSISGTRDNGFTIDNNTGAISAQKVTPKSANTDITIVYTPHKDAPVATTGKLTYIDDTTGKKLSWVNFSGAAGNHINYNAVDQIKNYESQGYDLVSDNYDKDGKTPVFDKDATKNVFEIHLVHATTPITPENPGKPGDKVPKDPTKPNEPDHKYPDNFEPQTLTKTITRDVTYVMADGSKAPDPVHQEVNFTGNGVLDLVTGHYVTVGEDGKLTPGKITWTQDKDGYDGVSAIDTTKYVITNVSESNTQANVDTKTGAVASEKVTPDNQNSMIVITLNKTPEPVKEQGNLEVVFHDDTTRQDIPGYGITIPNSDVGTKVTYTPTDDLTKLENEGYVYVSQDKNIPSEITKGDTKVIIHVKHGTKDINPKNPDPDRGYTKDSLVKTGTQTITYVGAGNQTPKENVTHVEFDHSLTIDTVTGKVIKDDGWKINGDNYKSVATPKVDGYTPDKTQAGGTQVTVDPKTGEGNIDVHDVVSYTKNPEPAKDQNAQVRYIDQDNHDSVITSSNVLTGKSGSTINYSTADIIKDLENKGYELVYDGFTGKNAKFDNDDSTTQTFDVVLKHKHTTITPKKPGNPGQPINPNDPNGPKWPNGTDTNSLIKAGTQTVHYVGAGDQTPKDNTTTIEFDHSITYDNVTGDVITDNGWTPDSKSYQFIDTPTVNGYTPDKIYVGGDTVKVTDDNINREYTVHYTKNPETPISVQGTVTYIDDTTGKTIDTDPLNGEVGKKINYTTAGKISNYESQGYELVSNNFKDGNETFAKFGNDFQVHLKHTTETITPKNPDPSRGYTEDSLKKSGTQTIIYQGAGDQTPQTNTSHVEFDHTLVIDKVTGEVIDDQGWKINGDNYKSVATPKIDGYIPDKTEVGGESVSVDPKTGEGDINKTYVVNYTKKPEVAKHHVTITIHDDTSNVDLPSYGYVSGDQSEGTKIIWNHDDVVKALENKGYKIVTDINVPGTIGNSDGDYVMHVEHTYIDVTPDKPGKPGEPTNPDNSNGPKYPDDYKTTDLTKTVTRTIHYVGAGTNTPSDVTQTVTFTQSGQFDAVTGKWTKELTWSGDQDVKGVTTPSINGYHVESVSGDSSDGKNVAEKTLSHNASDYVITVKYAEDPAPVIPTPTPELQPTNAPTTPQPTTPAQPTQASQASQASQPTQPSEPQEPDIPDVPDEKPVKKHHPKVTPKKNTPAPVGPSKSNSNNTPRPTTNTPTPTPYNNSVAPHSQNGYYNNSVAPHAQGTVGSNVAPNGQALPTGDTIGPKGTIVNAQGQVVGYIDSQGRPHFTLPQTGENNSTDTTAAIVGGVAMSLGLIGLAGVKKRRKNF